MLQIYRCAVLRETVWLHKVTGMVIIMGRLVWCCSGNREWGVGNIKWTVLIIQIDNTQC